MAEFGQLQSLRTLSRVEEGVEEGVERHTTPPWEKLAVSYGFPLGDNKC